MRGSASTKSTSRKKKGRESIGLLSTRTTSRVDLRRVNAGVATLGESLWLIAGGLFDLPNCILRSTNSSAVEDVTTTKEHTWYQVPFFAPHQPLITKKNRSCPPRPPPPSLSPSFGSTLQRQSLLTGFEEVYPLWALSIVNVGGLGWNTMEIGKVRAQPSRR